MEDSLLKRASYKYVLIRSLTVKPKQNLEGYFDFKNVIGGQHFTLLDVHEN